jgi:hypothetical protein
MEVRLFGQYIVLSILIVYLICQVNKSIFLVSLRNLSLGRIYLNLITTDFPQSGLHNRSKSMVSLELISNPYLEELIRFFWVICLLRISLTSI